MAPPRSKLLEGGGRGSELGQGLGPLRVDTPMDGHVVVVERGIEQVVEAEGDEQPLEEDEDRDPPGARTHDDTLEHMHADLHLGPQQHRDDGAGEHSKEGDHVDEGGAREHAQPLRKLGVKVLVVQADDHPRDKQGSNHAHVQRLDAAYRRQTRGVSDLGGEVDAQGRTPSS